MGGGIVDLLIGIVIIIILSIFYVILPCVLGFFFLSNRWISPKERRYFAYILFIDAFGIILLVSARFIFS